MRKVFVASIILAPFVAVCRFAYGAEAAASSGMLGLTLESLLIAYGPMAGFIVWFMCREKAREAAFLEAIRTRDKEYMDAIKQNVEVMTQVKEGLALTREDDEKGRTAIYRLVEEVRDISIRISAAGGTRIMTKNDPM